MTEKKINNEQQLKTIIFILKGENINKYGKTIKACNAKNSKVTKSRVKCNKNGNITTNKILEQVITCSEFI